MRVIFWDVDGVLNHRGHPGAWTNLWRPESLSPSLVLAACLLSQELKADCVLASMWRLRDGFGTGYEVALHCLHARGWADVYERFVGHTDFLPGKSRGAEISAWLARHPRYTQYAVVDDATDMDGVAHRLVEVDPSVGLMQADCDKVKELFA